jgi:hypothetical protein
LIALYQYGIRKHGGSLGTAFTPNNRNFWADLPSASSSITTATSGRQSGARAIETLVKDDFETKVLILPTVKTRTIF